MEIMYGEGISKTGEISRLVTRFGYHQKAMLGNLHTKNRSRDLEMPRSTWLIIQKSLDEIDQGLWFD